MTNKQNSRRDFLKATAAAAAAPYVIPRHVLAATGQPGANDRIRAGVIGCGSRISRVIGASPKDIQIVALADCNLRQMDHFPKRLIAAKSPLTVGKSTRYQDYRQMLDKEKLDAVYVGTTTHARALCCIHAVQAGLDAYAEKPLTLTIEEGQVLVKAVRKYERVFQVGTQAASFPVNRMGSLLVRDGALGKVQKVVTVNFVPGKKWPGRPGEPVPKGLNWDMWCNQVEMRPYNSQDFHTNAWKHWVAYDNGGQSWGMSGWGTHAFDQVQRGLGTESTGPVEVWPVKPGNPMSPVTMRYANGIVLEIKLSRGEGPTWGAVFIGEKGKIEINRWKVVSNPPELTKDIPLVKADKHATPPHVQNWVDCMRSRRRPNADVEYGHRATTICYLATIARELGRRLHWNPEKEVFVGDEEANRSMWVSRPRRKGYELPEIT